MQVSSNEECTYEENQRINGTTTGEHPINFLAPNQQTSVNFTNPGDLMDIENNPTGNIMEDGSFVLTPDYIQQTIKQALKQDNLTPDIEEKLINYQKYQEERTGGTTIQHQHVATALSSPPSLIETLHHHHIQQQPLQTQSIIQQHHTIINTNNFDNNSLSSPPNSPVKVRKRQTNKHDDDEDWVMDTPRKRNNMSSNRTHYGTRGGVQLNSPDLQEDPNDLDDSDLSQDDDHISNQVNRKVAAIKREMERKKPNYQVMVSTDPLLL